MKAYQLFIKMRAGLLVWLTHQMALPLLKLIRKPQRFPYTLEKLQGFPEGTLGKDLVNFLAVKQLELLPYYARHDIKHVLLGYDTTEEGEGCLQCFMLGNRHVSFPVLATVMYCFIAMPEYWDKFIAAFKRGRANETIRHWKWFELLSIQTVELQNKIA
jgi:ubiquinone biosynthesis protein Coq4